MLYLAWSTNIRPVGDYNIYASICVQVFGTITSNMATRDHTGKHVNDDHVS